METTLKKIEEKKQLILQQSKNFEELQKSKTNLTAKEIKKLEKELTKKSIIEIKDIDKKYKNIERQQRKNNNG